MARADADAELEAYIEARVDQFVARGLTPAAARVEALSRLGGTVGDVRAMLQHSAARREGQMRIRDMLDDAVQDLRYAARGLIRRPGFTGAAVLCLAIGIGANATMFGIVDALLLRPPAGVSDPGNLLWINSQRTTPLGFKEMSGLSYPDYAAFSGSPGIRAAAAYHMKTEVFEGDANARQINALIVTPTFMPLLGVRPAVGRFFATGEDQPAAQPLVVLGYEFWQAQFAGDANIIGRTLRIGTTIYTAIGVAPRGFNGVERARVDVFLPTAAGFSTPSIFTTRGTTWLTMLARLEPGVRRDGVAEALDTVYHRGDGGARVRIANRIVVASPTGIAAMHDAVEVKNATLSIWLAAVAGIVLLIACANVASLLLTRAARRRREIAVRLALGVGRARLVRMLMTESLLLAAIGGGAGLLLAHWGGSIFRTSLVTKADVGVSAFSVRVLVVTLMATVVTGLACGVAPAVQATRPDLTVALKSGEREGSSVHGRVLGALLVGQVALTLVLLVSAALFVRSLRNLDILDLGFDVQQLLRARVTVGAGSSPAEADELVHQLLERTRSLPGVERAALATAGPFGNGMMLPVTIPGRARDSTVTTPGISAVTPEFFAALGVRLRRGRLFTPADRLGGQLVAIVNEEMARRSWAGSDPLGKCIKVGGDAMPCTTVVGVVANTRQGNITRQSIQYERIREGYYVPLEQQPVPKRVGHFGVMLYVRASSNGGSLLPAVRRTMQAVIPAAPLPDVAAFSTLLEPQIRPWRLGVMMFGLFGVIALALALVGLYGVLAFNVSQRTREIGVRVALGAGRRDVHRLVLGQGLRLSALGVGVGLVAALTIGRGLAAIVFGVSPRDPVVLGTVSAAMLLVAALASYLPAVRATRIDPMEALRDL
jgi:putative ABC transport system permease protein